MSRVRGNDGTDAMLNLNQAFCSKCPDGITNDGSAYPKLGDEFPFRWQCVTTRVVASQNCLLQRIRYKLMQFFRSKLVETDRRP